MKNLSIDLRNNKKSLAEVILSKEEFQLLGTREIFEMSRMDAQDQMSETLID
jgi:hypothetical protein